MLLQGQYFAKVVIILKKKYLPFEHKFSRAIISQVCVFGVFFCLFFCLFILSLPPENIRKLYDFLRFSGGRERVHTEQIVYINTNVYINTAIMKDLYF